jgi:Ca-activated chloride channel family protein
MTWFNSFGIVEIVLASAFALLYLFYIGKIHRIASALKTTPRRVWIKFGLRLLYFGLMIVALLGPSFGEVLKKEVKTIGKDIYIAVDLSQSMNATDIQPSRIEKIKFEIKKIIEEFSSDRVGLIIFSSEAFLQCPLTYDQSALNLWVESLKTSLVPSGGTDFGPALKMAAAKLKDEDPAQKNQAKLVILISDGEDFGEETQEMVNELENNKIPVFTLGVGTAEGGKIPYRERSYKRDQSGREVVTVLNPASLKDLAEQTKGQYFELNDKQNDVNKLIRAVKEVKGELRDVKQMDIAANDYRYFLLAALLLLLLDVLLTVRTVKI